MLGYYRMKLFEALRRPKKKKLENTENQVTEAVSDIKLYVLNTCCSYSQHPCSTPFSQALGCHSRLRSGTG